MLHFRTSGSYNWMPLQVDKMNVPLRTRCPGTVNVKIEISSFRMSRNGKVSQGSCHENSRRELLEFEMTLTSRSTHNEIESELTTTLCKNVCRRRRRRRCRRHCRATQNRCGFYFCLSSSLRRTWTSAAHFVFISLNLFNVACMCVCGTIVIECVIQFQLTLVRWFCFFFLVENNQKQFLCGGSGDSGRNQCKLASPMTMTTTTV